jgi:hypothetical protein
MEEKKKPKVPDWDRCSADELKERLDRLETAIGRLEGRVDTLEEVVQVDLDFNTPLKMETDQ